MRDATHRERPPRALHKSPRHPSASSSSAAGKHPVPQIALLRPPQQTAEAWWKSVWNLRGHRPPSSPWLPRRCCAPRSEALLRGCTSSIHPATNPSPGHPLPALASRSPGRPPAQSSTRAEARPCPCVLPSVHAAPAAGVRPSFGTSLPHRLRGQPILALRRSLFDCLRCCTLRCRLGPTPLTRPVHRHTHRPDTPSPYKVRGFQRNPRLLPPIMHLCE